MDRPQLLEMAHRNSAPGMDLGRFAMIFGEWDFMPIRAKSQIVGVVMTRDSEIHMAIEPAFHRRIAGWRDGLFELVQPVIDKFGCATTVTQANDINTNRFIERIGFVLDRTENGISHYKINAIKLKKRGQSCQQSSQS